MSGHCFAGKSLYVDLTKRHVEIRRTQDAENGFLGGRGLNQSLLLEQQRQGAPPFDENTPLIFGAGRLVGTGAPCASRMNIDSMNIFTGGIGSSNVGGSVAAALKAAGVDHVFVKGKSEKPVYLWVSTGRVEIRDAGQLWGKLIVETGRLLRQSLGNKRIHYVAVGPAGENRVWSSAIIEGHARAAGRCGLGAVMGDKKLKALVVQGTGKRPIQTARPDQFSRLVKEFSEKLSSLPAVGRKRRFGTVAAIPTLNGMGAMPVRNYQDEYLSGDKLRPYLPEVFEGLSTGRVSSCQPCVIACHHRYRGASPDRTPHDKLEANTVWDFGPRLGLPNAEDLLTCHSMCTHYGMDIDNTASVICWAMDSFDKGILNISDTEGLILRWGDARVVFQLIRKIALREGIGDLLAEGSRQASLRIGKGSERLSFHIKGQDLIEPIRSCKGWALGVVVSPRGGTHTRGAPQTEFYRVERDMSKRMWGVESAGIPGTYRGKPQVVVYYERLHALLDSLGICFFASNWSSPAPGQLGPSDLAELCSAALGEEFSEESLMERGERILTLEKIYNRIHTDFDRKDDYPPELFFEEPIKTGPFQGEKLDREEWGRMLHEYYSLHGWDPETSYPTEERLKVLGLGNYLKLLPDRGKSS